MFRIFDAHAHTYPEAIAARACANLAEFYSFPVDNKGTYDDLEEKGKKLGFGGFLLFCVATNPHQVEKVNDAVAASVRLSREHGFKTVGFASMHQDYPDFEAELDRAASLGLTGVKLHPDIQGIDLDDAKLLPLYEIMCAKKMKLCLHMGDDRTTFRYSSPDKLVRLSSLFPALEITAAHFGGYKSFNESVPVLKGIKNMMFDTSSSLWLMSPEKAAEIIGTLGEENIMFGTDYPVPDLSDEVERFMKIKLTDKEREDILWNNAERYFALDKIQ